MKMAGQHRSQTRRRASLTARSAHPSLSCALRRGGELALGGIFEKISRKAWVQGKLSYQIGGRREGSCTL